MGQALRSFTLTHPDTGQTLVVESAEAPSQKEAEQLFIDNPQPVADPMTEQVVEETPIDGELPEGDWTDAITEPAKAVGAGLAG